MQCFVNSLRSRKVKSVKCDRHNASTYSTQAVRKFWAERSIPQEKQPVCPPDMEPCNIFMFDKLINFFQRKKAWWCGNNWTHSKGVIGNSKKKKKCILLPFVEGKEWGNTYIREEETRTEEKKLVYSYKYLLIPHFVPPLFDWVSYINRNCSPKHLLPAYNHNGVTCP
jgi:hypothetical protein